MPVRYRQPSLFTSQANESKALPAILSGTFGTRYKYIGNCTKILLSVRLRGDIEFCTGIKCFSTHDLL